MIAILRPAEKGYKLSTFKAEQSVTLNDQADKHTGKTTKSSHHFRGYCCFLNNIKQIKTHSQALPRLLP